MEYAPYAQDSFEYFTCIYLILTIFYCDTILLGIMLLPLHFIVAEAKA